MKKVIAFYLPQYHEIEENNKWWGNGFTEWNHLHNWNPLFEGHSIKFPHESIGYYNLLNTETRSKQAQLAKEHNIYGFCYYHYWSCGNKLLQKPLELMLNDNEPDLPFMLSWANENWTRRWDGFDQDVLWKQDYGEEEEWENHIQYLMAFFKNDNYIKINNSPALVVYKLLNIPNFQKRIEYYKKRTTEHGFNGLHLIMTMQSEENYIKSNELIGTVDAMAQFEPIFSLNHLFRNNIFITQESNSRVYDINKHWEFIENRNFDVAMPHYKGTFIGWDNSPRVKDAGMIFGGGTPSQFKNHLQNILQNSKEDFVFITAWNEWGEGCVIEPDAKNEYKYIEAIRDSVNEVNSKK